MEDSATVVKRNSSGTPDSSSKQQPMERCDHNSPLMKLVDAAASLGKGKMMIELGTHGGNDGLASPVNEGEGGFNELGTHRGNDGIDGMASPVNDTSPVNEVEREFNEQGTLSPGFAISVASEDNQPVPLEVDEDSKVIRGNILDIMSRQEKKLTFAEFLMQCLNDEANGDVLRWMPCGTQFTITNHRKFTMERMPQLFKIRNMSSFVRKLTRWGFSRVHEKATGNSDIFKHPHFQRDKPELCKRIRCVNRSVLDEGKVMNIPMDMRLDSTALMGNFSETSSRNPGLDFAQDLSLRMGSPRGSTGHSMSHFHGRSPMESSRYHLNQTPRGSTHYLPPRISPESDREMMERSAFHSRLSPPHVYSPPLLSRTMSAAAEYELEQFLLERQRARMYRGDHQPHHLHKIPQSNMRGHPVDVPLPSTRNQLEAGSERSADSFGDRRYGSGQIFHDAPADPGSIATALEKLRREGEYDLDMSPREAMLRAVLHKRQQQRAMQHHRSGSSLGHGTLNHPNSYSTSSPTVREPNSGRVDPSYFR